MLTERRVFALYKILYSNAVTSTTNNVVIQLINIADSVQLCIKKPVASIPTENIQNWLERF